MKLNVSATRMELMRLKKRVLLARRGHKLLKDKQDQLMRKFLELIDLYKTKRKQIDDKLMKIYYEFFLGSVEFSDSQLKSFFLLPSVKVELEKKLVPVMNLRLPEFNIKIEGETRTTGVFDVNPQLDFSLEKFVKLLPELVKLAELENNVKELAEELERTRRRVNALEYILIPDLEETIKYISMKIGEVERSNITRLMKIKEIVEEKE
jgi:V/A-type H+-transporting ATPase subunit D